jgi:hypothetical protein
MADQLLTEREANLQGAIARLEITEAKLGSQAPFVKFVENNDHEGEKWTFWLQVHGNESALDKLADVIRQYEEANDAGPGWSEYRLHEGTVIPERDVDVLVKHGGGGYMNNHNKVTGTLQVPDDLLGDGEYGKNLDRLYKGGIENLFYSEAA